MTVSGVQETINFWESLYQFFINQIEPKWGRVHKGHIFFYMGIARAQNSIDSAKNDLEKAYSEDCITEKERGGTAQEIEQRLQKYSAYVALAILERITDAALSDNVDLQHFWGGLFGPSFNAAILGHSVNPALIEKSLDCLSAPEMHDMIIERYTELELVTRNNLAFSCVSTAGSVLEAILLGILHYKLGLTTLSGHNKNIMREELGPLFKESKNRNLFPSKSVESSLELIYIFRNRLHPGNEIQQTYKLTPRVSLSLRILFDIALIEWGRGSS